MMPLQVYRHGNKGAYDNNKSIFAISFHKREDNKKQNRCCWMNIVISICMSKVAHKITHSCKRGINRDNLNMLPTSIIISLRK